MRRLTPADVASELRSLGFPVVFRDVVLGQHKKYGIGLNIYFERPSEFYRILREHPEEVPFAATILPLHESNFDSFWSYVPAPDGVFIRHSIESLPSNYIIIAKSLPEYFEYEVRRLCDNGIEPDKLRGFCNLLGSPDIMSLVDDYENSQ